MCLVSLALKLLSESPVSVKSAELAAVFLIKSLLFISSPFVSVNRLITIEETRLSSESILKLLKELSELYQTLPA